MMGLVVCSMMWCQSELELESWFVIDVEIVVVVEEGKVRIWSCGGWGECVGGIVQIERMGWVLGMLCMMWILCVEDLVEFVEEVGERMAVGAAEVFG